MPLLQAEAAAHGAGGEVAQHELQLGHGELAHLHQALVHISAQVVGGDAVLLHDLEEVLGDLQADLALAFHAAAHGVEAGVKVAVLAGGGILEERDSPRRCPRSAGRFWSFRRTGFSCVFPPYFHSVSVFLGYIVVIIALPRKNGKSLDKNFFVASTIFFPLFSVFPCHSLLRDRQSGPWLEPNPPSVIG